MIAAIPWVETVQRRQLLIGGSMAVTAIVSHLAIPRPGPRILSSGGLDPIIPKRFAGWGLVQSPEFVLPPSDQTEERVYDQILTRTYAAAGHDEIMLLIAFGGGQTGMLEIHRPEACYPAQGYSLSGRQEVDLPVGPAGVPAVMCTATSAVRCEQLLYWTRIGDKFPRSWAEAQIATIGSNLTGVLPDGVLVRISTISRDAERSHEQLGQFASALADATTGLAHRLIFGTVGRALT